MKSNKSVLHCHSAFMYLCRVCFRPVHAVTHPPTSHSEHKTHTVNPKDMFNQALKTPKQLTKQPGTVHPSQSTQTLYSQALRAQTRPALRPRPSPWPVPSALKQTHPAPFNGEHLRYDDCFLHTCTGDVLAHIWTHCTSNLKHVTLTIGPSCAQGDEVIGENISEKQTTSVNVDLNLCSSTHIWYRTPLFKTK